MALRLFWEYFYQMLNTIMSHLTEYFKHCICIICLLFIKHYLLIHELGLYAVLLITMLRAWVNYRCSAHLAIICLRDNFDILATYHESEHTK